MIQIKKWFLEKSFNNNECYVISVADLRIEKETEKAVYIVAVSDFGTLRFWCPKSCLMSEADYQEQAKRFENACSKYEQLKQLAKDNGIKVTARMRKQTLLERMSKELIQKAVEMGLISQYEAFNI